MNLTHTPEVGLIVNHLRKLKNTGQKLEIERAYFYIGMACVFRYVSDVEGTYELPVANKSITCEIFFHTFAALYLISL